MDVLMTWIDRQMEGYKPPEAPEPSLKKKKKEPEYEQLTLPFL